MFDFNENQPEMTLSPQSLSYFIRNGYELKLYNKKMMKATAVRCRVLIPVIPVLGKTMREDFGCFSSNNEDWREHAEEAGCVKFDVSITGDLLCEFKSIPGILLRVPEVSAYISSTYNQTAFYKKGKELLMQFSKEGLADEFSKLFRSPLEMSGRNLHVGCVLRVIKLMDDEVLGYVRRAFLDCDDLSKKGICDFCVEKMRVQE